MSDVMIFRLIDLGQQGRARYVLMLGVGSEGVRAVAIDNLKYDPGIQAYIGLRGTDMAVTFSADTPFQLYPYAYIESLTQGEVLEEQFNAAHAEKMVRDRIDRIMDSE